MSTKTESARRRRRYVGYPLEAALLYVIYGIFMVLPLDAASALGGWIGRTIGPRLGTSRKARRNLDRAMPELSAERREEILIGMWDNLGRVMAEYPHLNEIWKRTEVVGAEIVQDIAASKKPALFYSAHTGNWEIALLGAARQRSVGHGGLSPTQQPGRTLADRPRPLGDRQPARAQGPRWRSGSRGDPARRTVPSAC